MSVLMAKAVFYDATRRRLHLYRWTTRILVILFASSFAFTGWSVFHNVALPKLALPDAAPIRAVANVLPGTAPTTSLSLPSSLAEARLKQIQKNSAIDQVPKRWGFFVNWDDNSFSSLKANIHSLDGLMPEWLHVAGVDGTIAIDDPNRQQEVLEYVRRERPGLPIVPLVNNYSSETQDWDGARLAGMLSNPEARSRTIAQLLDFVARNGCAGISIDFENVPARSQQNLAAFMSELSAAFHQERYLVTQNIPLEDDSFQAGVLGKYADQIILMAYDEHALGSDAAGSIAGQSWYERALVARLGELPADRYIVALGGYGYDWTGAGQGGSEVSFQDVMRLARDASAPVTLDSATLNPQFDYRSATGEVHHVWYLDAATVFNETGFAAKYHPAGYAVWRLGAEDPRIWQVLNARNALQSDAALVDALKTMPYGYDLDYEGQGEVLRVTGSPQNGNADLTYDALRAMITEERVRTYPSGYVITRYGGQDPKKIVLTFDDGPDPEYTPRILSVLEQYHVPATFFVVGVNASQNPELLRRIVADGDTIGSHTFSHPDITRISPSQFRLELNAFQRLIESVVRRQVVLFRPPYAEDIEPAIPEQIMPLLTTSELGYSTVAMHIDPNDWAQPGTSAEVIASRVVDAAKNGEGNIVLLHDGGGDREQTVLALPKILTGLRAAGFQVVSLADLVGVDQRDLMPSADSSDQPALWANAFSFGFLDHFGALVRFFFFAGIALGLGRLLVILLLAVTQKGKGLITPRRRFRADFQPSVSVIVPAYNEARVIVQTIESILKSDYPHFDIVVVDDGSTDETWTLLQDRFSQQTQIRLHHQENQGKSAALNFGITQTQAEVIVTLDADTQFRFDTISKLVRHFADSRIGAVAGNAKVGNRVNILTKWQALEYIVSQNLDRRALEMLNAITVVPGSVGAWRREAVVRAHGFSSQTLAEDADLTFGIIRQGYRVVYEEDAYGFTEAPATIRGFISQRFRWMYGTMQTVYKHGVLFLNFRRGGGLGWVAMPNILLFQILFPLVSPAIDLMLIFSIAWVIVQHVQHPIDYSVSLGPILWFYAAFTIVDVAIALIAFGLEKRREQWSLILWLPLQRFFYRQLMYYVAFKVVATILKGSLVRWGRQQRRATVVLQKVEISSV